MANKVNLRELILNILLEINREGQYSHLVIRDNSEKVPVSGEGNRKEPLSPESARELWSTGSGWTISWINIPQFPAAKNEAGYQGTAAEQCISAFIYGSCAGQRCMQ